MNNKNIHECKRKISPIWEISLDSQGTIYCISCGEILNELQVHPNAFKKSRGKY